MHRPWGSGSLNSIRVNSKKYYFALPKRTVVRDTTVVATTLLCPQFPTIASSCISVAGRRRSTPASAFKDAAGAPEAAEAEAGAGGEWRREQQKQQKQSSRPAAQATAGGAMDLVSLSTAAGAATSTGAAMYGPAAGELLEEAEYDAETEDVAGSSDVAAAAGMGPPRPVDWAAAGAAEDWQMGNASAEAAMTAAGGAAE